VESPWDCCLDQPSGSLTGFWVSLELGPSVASKDDPELWSPALLCGEGVAGVQAVPQQVMSPKVAIFLCELPYTSDSILPTPLQPVPTSTLPGALGSISSCPPVLASRIVQTTFMLPSSVPPNRQQSNLTVSFCSEPFYGSLSPLG
jgi:hypothetical protein